MPTPRKTPTAKTCVNCGAEFLTVRNQQKCCSQRCAVAWWDKTHPEARAALSKKWRQANPEKVREAKRNWYRGRPTTQKAKEAHQVRYIATIRNDRLVRTYGITRDEYELLWIEQNGVCAICRQPETKKSRNGTTWQLSVDHDRDTGTVRSLLCANCNLAIGNMRHDPALLRAGAEYVQDWNAITRG